MFVYFELNLAMSPSQVPQSEKEALLKQTHPEQARTKRKPRSFVQRSGSQAAEAQSLAAQQSKEEDALRPC